MTKADIISAIKAKAGITRAEAEQAFDAVVDSVTETLKGGGKVSLVGFGTFDVVTRAARTGRNPKTGAEIKIGASKTPRFKAGKALKQAIK